MKFKFKVQQYQTDAADAVTSVFEGQPNQGAPSTCAIWAASPSTRRVRSTSATIPTASCPSWPPSCPAGGRGRDGASPGGDRGLFYRPLLLPGHRRPHPGGAPEAGTGRGLRHPGRVSAAAGSHAGPEGGQAHVLGGHHGDRLGLLRRRVGRPAGPELSGGGRHRKLHPHAGGDRGRTPPGADFIELCACTQAAWGLLHGRDPYAPGCASST